MKFKRGDKVVICAYKAMLSDYREIRGEVVMRYARDEGNFYTIIDGHGILYTRDEDMIKLDYYETFVSLYLR